MSFNKRLLQSNRKDLLCLQQEVYLEQTNSQNKIERIMRAFKQISNDATRIKKKIRREAHKEHFQRAQEVEEALAVDYDVHGAKRKLNNAQ